MTTEVLMLSGCETIGNVDKRVQYSRLVVFCQTVCDFFERLIINLDDI